MLETRFTSRRVRRWVGVTFWGGGASTGRSVRFRPRLDSLDERALPDAGVVSPPPDQPPAQPAADPATEVDFGATVYIVDDSGVTQTTLVGNADGSVTTTTRDVASPTGWTATTSTANGGLSRAVGDNPGNLPPALGALGGGAVLGSLGGVIKIGGGADQGGITITWSKDPLSGGFSVTVVLGGTLGPPSTTVFNSDGSWTHIPANRPPQYHPPAAPPQ